MGPRLVIVRGVAVFVGVALLVLAPWLVRTALASGGNPVFPLAARALGAGHFDAGQVERFAVAHAPRPDQRALGARFDALWRQVGGDYHYGVGRVGGVPLVWWGVLALVVGVVARRDREAWAWLALIVGNVLVWLAATHLQGRFLVQVIPLLALLAACAAGSGRRRASDQAVAAPRVAAHAPLLALLGVYVAAVALAWPTVLGRLREASVAAGVPSPAALRDLLPPAVAAAIYDTDRPLVLVGDAKAFWYAVPQARLRYRSVFDVPGDRPFADAWIGADVPADALVIVDPGELRRFARTYRNLPALPPEWADRQEAFVVEARALRARLNAQT